MPRPIEFIKKQEARIMIFLRTAKSYFRNGDDISRKLNIDYRYVMLLLRAMYKKGWIRTHEYNGRRFFNTTMEAPIIEAEQRLCDDQMKLKIDGVIKGKEFSKAIIDEGNEP